MQTWTDKYARLSQNKRAQVLFYADKVAKHIQGLKRGSEVDYSKSDDRDLIELAVYHLMSCGMDITTNKHRILINYKLTDFSSHGRTTKHIFVR